MVANVHVLDLIRAIFIQSYTEGEIPCDRQYIWCDVGAKATPGYETPSFPPKAKEEAALFIYSCTEAAGALTLTTVKSASIRRRRSRSAGLLAQEMGECRGLTRDVAAAYYREDAGLGGGGGGGGAICRHSLLTQT